MDPGLPDLPQPSPTTASDSYRSDIDGLRAIAVMAVVVFHYSFAGWHLPGGFFGVDVFFVISGYLITGLIMNAVDRGEFRLRDFYRRRFQRLAPALLTLLCATLLAGYLLLLPSDYADLGTSARYALFALSNFYFYGETGYFDQAAHLRPLLHTWSLAIEEQFYLVWPPLLLLLHRLGGRVWVITGIGVVTLGSLVYCLFLVRWEQSAAFYSPLARAWELAIGGLLSFAPPLSRRHRFSNWATGIALIGLALAFTAPLSPHSVPGLGTLLPIAATLVLLYPKCDPPKSAVILTRPMLRYLGRISYSLYLWHWPVLVFGLHFNAGRPLTLILSLSLLGLALLLAMGAYHSIETPLRYWRFQERRGLLAALSAVCCISLGALWVTQADGLPERVYADGQPRLDRASQWAWQATRPSATDLAGHQAFGAPWREATQRLILWGDSHAAHFAPLLEQLIEQQAPSTSVLLASGCMPTLDGTRFRAIDQGERINRECAQERRQLLDFIDRTPYPIDRVVLAAAWSTRWQMLTSVPDHHAGSLLQHQALAATVDELRAKGVAVSIVGQIPQWPENPTPCVAANLKGLWRRSCTPTLASADLPAAFQPVHELLPTLSAPGVQVLLPHQRLCNEQGCLTELGGEFLYRDSNHLRRNLSSGALTELAMRAGFDTLL